MYVGVINKKRTKTSKKYGPIKTKINKYTKKNNERNKKHENVQK